MATIGAVIAVGAGCGDDDDEDTLSVVATAKGTHIRTVDLGDQGRSSGDLFVFDSPPVDSEEKEPVGKVYGTQTTIAVAGTEVVQANITYDLGDGDRITVGGISEYPRGGNGLVVNREFERPILGGTGQYAGAQGTLTSVRRPDNSYEHTFHLEN